MLIRSTNVLALVVSALLLPACSEQQDAPTAPGAAPQPLADVVSVAQEPFTVRAPMDPYRINQPPDFMVHSRARTDFVIQRNVFVPGAGGWHTHPGPTFVLVVQGQIKLTESTKDGCEDTEVFGPGQAYVEEGEHVHRAVVLGTEDVVLLVARFNIPLGALITTPAADPGC
jgi:hypothetical protein